MKQRVSAPESRPEERLWESALGGRKPAEALNAAR